MPDYRNKLTVSSSAGQRIIILQCNASEKKSLIRHHKEDGEAVWLSERVASKHQNGKPKHLHLAVLSEGIYEVVGQPVLSGFYCFYRDSKGQLYYAPINAADRLALADAKAKGSSYREALTALGKRVF